MRVTVPAGVWPDAGDAGGGATLPERWAARWARHPAAPVLVDGWDAAHTLDGAALDGATARVAGALRRRGVEPGARVLWSAPATLPGVVTLLGIVRAGAVLVPLSPSATPREVAHVAADAAPVLAVGDRPLGAGVTDCSMERLMEATLDAPAETATSGPGDDALIVYTSGTTGSPKGAVHTHASLLAGVAALQSAWEWRREDRLILALPLFHVHGLCAGLLGTLAAGASAVVFDRFDTEAVLDAAATGGTMLFGVPTMYHRLAASGRASELAALRVCVSGSAPLPGDLWRTLHAEGVDVLERYGMTESLLTLSNPLTGERRPGSVGVPLPGVEAALDDADEEGVGMLVVRGPSLCRGYWGRPSPLTDAEGWFTTGDLASVSRDGYVTIRGRRTEVIITGGHNVYPAEVEAVLSRHPSVAEVAVVGAPSDEWGEVVVAYVVGADVEPDIDALTALAAAELAPFKRPRALHVVPALPRNAMGKVVRATLRQGPGPAGDVG